MTEKHEKTPRELLRETLERCSLEVASWPAWMRSAASTASVFHVPVREEQPKPSLSDEPSSSRA